MNTDMRPDDQPTTEWIDKIYPSDVFGTTFTRKQVAWMIATYVLEEDRAFRKVLALSEGGTMTRADLEALYRKYFLEIRKFEPFPMAVSYENVLDFVEWLKRQ
jgi:hypothetical protein